MYVSLSTLCNLWNSWGLKISFSVPQSFYSPERSCRLSSLSPLSITFSTLLLSRLVTSDTSESSWSSLLLLSLLSLNNVNTHTKVKYTVKSWEISISRFSVSSQTKLSLILIRLIPFVDSKGQGWITSHFLLFFWPKWSMLRPKWGYLWKYQTELINIKTPQLCHIKVSNNVLFMLVDSFHH